MTEKVFNFRIDGIDLVEKQLFRTVVNEEDHFSFDTQVQTIIDEIKKIVVVFVGVNIKKGAEPQPLCAKFLIAVGFIVDNFEISFDRNEQGQLVIPQDLDLMFKGVAISTMRGVIFSELRGTTIHRAILPVIMLDTLKPIAENLVDVKKL